MAAIGAGWVDGAWTEAGWASGAWASASTPVITATPGGDVVGSVQTLIHDTGAKLRATLTNDTLIAADTGVIGSSAQSDAIVAGITSAQSESGGWNNQVRDALDGTDLTRVSDTVFELTIPATSGYVITADETITITIPNAVLTTSSTDVVADNFQVKAGIGGLFDMVQDIAQDLTQDITADLAS